MAKRHRVSVPNHTSYHERRHTTSRHPRPDALLARRGRGADRHAWKGAGENLGAAGYHGVAFDARGHGDSDWAPNGLYGQDVMVEDLKCVVAALGNRRPVLLFSSK